MTSSSFGNISSISISKTMKKTLISITLTLSLIMSFALSAPPVQALPANSNAYIANLTDANISNLEHGTLIFGIFGKIAKTAAKAAKKTSKAASKSAKKTSKAASKSAKKTSKASSKAAASKTKGGSGSMKRSSSPVHRQRELRSVTIDRYEVDKSHLGTGTRTTAKTRKYVNNPNTPVPHTIESSFRSGKHSGSVTVRNPRSKRMDGGHKLGKQSGGKGHLNEHVFPQNSSINRGTGGNRKWRNHEDNFKAAVQKNGSGTYQVRQLYR